MVIFKSTSFVNRPLALTDSTGDGSVLPCLKILTGFFTHAQRRRHFFVRQLLFFFFFFANLGFQCTCRSFWPNWSQRAQMDLWFPTCRSCRCFITKVTMYLGSGFICGPMSCIVRGVQCICEKSVLGSHRVLPPSLTWAYGVGVVLTSSAQALILHSY